MKDKKGIATVDLFEYFVVGFILIILIGVFAYAFNVTTNAIGMDVMAGSVNLSNATGDTLGRLNTALFDKLDLIGMFILFGLIIALLVNAYFTRENHPKVFIIVDIILIVFAYILAVYIANAFETILNLDLFGTVFTVSLGSTSVFLLRLPIIITIVGLLIMIITYIGIPKSIKEETFVGST